MTDFSHLPDLASRASGGAVVAANDEFFAAKENLVLPEPPAARAEFGHKGKEYDGWETRRRRSPGHDWAIVRLGVPGVVSGVVIDTTHFTGNYPPRGSVEGAAVEGHPTVDELTKAAWQPLLPLSSLSGNKHNYFPVYSDRRVTHVRLTIHPDGGVARLRVHGRVLADPRLVAAGPPGAGAARRAPGRGRPARPGGARERRPGRRREQRVLRPPAAADRPR